MQARLIIAALLMASSLVAVLASGCSSPAPRPASGDDAAATVLLLGEQHDAQEHADLHAQRVRALAAQGRLAALVLEMAPLGATTSGIATQAGEDPVRLALHWDERAWPWSRYAPAVMAAVRAGVPVLGSAIDAAQMRQAMGDASIDALLPAPALQRQRSAVEDGHCGLLPATQIAPMTRVQIARDRAMARVIESALEPGRTVVLLAGSGHVDAQVGVPRHLRASLAVQAQPGPRAPPARDYCADLREQLRPAGR